MLHNLYYATDTNSNTCKYVNELQEQMNKTFLNYATLKRNFFVFVTGIALHSVLVFSELQAVQSKTKSKSSAFTSSRTLLQKHCNRTTRKTTANDKCECTLKKVKRHSGLTAYVVNTHARTKRARARDHCKGGLEYPMLLLNCSYCDVPGR